MIRARLIRLSAIILSVLAVTIFWGIYRIDRADDPSLPESVANSSHTISSTATFIDTTRDISFPRDANTLPTNILALPSTAATQPAQFRPALPAIPVPPPIVVPFEWPEYPFSGKLIAAEPNSPSFTVLDFTEKGDEDISARTSSPVRSSRRCDAHHTGRYDSRNQPDSLLSA